ncbi:MAG TPA: DUF4375 domain-containing protein [Chthoniobacterales bacterium]
MKFLEKYNGQTVDQLIAMESDYRVDSLVLAFEQAMEQKKAKQKLSPAEIDILAVEAMEREVNNGGYHQFFLNSSREYAAVLPSSLERIGCPVAAKIASDALACLKISGEVTAAKIDAALQRLGGTAVEDLGKMDERYFQNEEPIAGRLFARIKAQKGQIVLR